SEAEWPGRGRARPERIPEPRDTSAQALAPSSRAVFGARRHEPRARDELARFLDARQELFFGLVLWIGVRADPSLEDLAHPAIEERVDAAGLLPTAELDHELHVVALPCGLGEVRRAYEPRDPTVVVLDG